MDTTKGTHKRFAAFRRKRVTFVLRDRHGRYVLVPVIMPIRVRLAAHDHNVYEGHIFKAWCLMPINWTSLDYVGTLVSETDRQWAHRIQWVMEADPTAHPPTKVRNAPKDPGVGEAAHEEV